jgi:peptidoglycan/LPS O-acetylase OafA/YrhL
MGLLEMCGMKSGPSSHLAYLDGLRGLAALWVLLAHCMIWGGWYWHRMPSPKIAVDVFMVLSGFLMVYQWYAKLEDDGRINTGTVVRFYLRRFFRIAPLFYIVLLLVFLLGPIFLHGYSILRAHNPAQFENDTIYDPANIHYTLKNLLMHVSFLFGLFPKYAFSTFLPDWSISLEMQFYAAFPLLLWSFRKVGAIATLLACLFAMKLWTHAGVFFPEPSFLLIKLNVFLVGMLIAEGVRTFDAAPQHAAVLGLLAVLISPQDSVLVACVAILLFFMGITRESNPAPAAIRVRTLINHLLGNRLANFLADTSYAVYLTHGFFVSLAGGWLFSQARFVAMSPRHRVAVLSLITLAGCYTLSWILHWCVERPGIKLGRKAVESVPDHRPKSTSRPVMAATSRS